MDIEERAIESHSIMGKIKHTAKEEIKPWLCSYLSDNTYCLVRHWSEEKVSLCSDFAALVRQNGIAYWGVHFKQNK